MKQRLALGFALVKKPKILLLDEPTNGLDPAGIHEIRQLIIRLAKEEGITVFISSHILSEIEHLADRVGIINRGQLVYEGDVETIKSNMWIEISGDFSQHNMLQFLNQQTKVPILEFKNGQMKLKNLPDDRIALLVKELVRAGYPIFSVVRE